MSPPPEYCTRHTNGSQKDLGSSLWRNESSQQSCYNNSQTSGTCSDDISSDVSRELGANNNDDNNNIGIVKTILGPTFEDAVLRTLEFGKSLIQKSDETEKEIRVVRKRHGANAKKMRFNVAKENGVRKQCHKKEVKECNREPRNPRKRLVYSLKTENDSASDGRQLDVAKNPFVSKIRSLDSELKGMSPTPEEIKKELEALIQINKDVPPECPNWGYLKKLQETKPLGYAMLANQLMQKPE